ncbi:MAG: sulfite exporter TauE/SafE family protein [Alphaproteobacteria bacterium]
MSLAFLLPFAGLGIVVGVLIGCVGIGGVLLVPALVYLGGVEVHTAVATCMLVYLFSGTVGTLLYARRGSIDWPMAVWLCIGAMPAALLGALVMTALPGRALELLIAALVLFAGVNALAGRRAGAREQGSLEGPKLAALGALTGFGSALSGTGGPLILIPLLVWLRLPALAAVGLGQAIQIPVALLATAGNLVAGSVALALGALLAATLVGGTVAGARLAHAIPAKALERSVAGVLVLTGLFMLARLAAPLLGA